MYFLSSQKLKFAKKIYMNLEGILHVSGKSGLYKVISKGKSTIIVESIIENKRSPIYSHNPANMLEEIGVYTHNDTIPLADVFEKIAIKEKNKATISHKISKNELILFFKSILPEYDEERVYISDIKKIIQWYNILQNAGLIKVKIKGDKKQKNEI
tara:strand:+ start:60584 stop:61051 length:468 start_codon:yes stop_codon:yes gene_type:complete